jgi:hypothetical protein
LLPPPTRETKVPDLEQRVSLLEQEMATLKGRVGLIDEDTRSIPDLIKMEFRLAGSQNARMSRDIAELQRSVAELQELPAKVEALPRVVAELVVEMLGERERKR